MRGRCTLHAAGQGEAEREKEVTREPMSGAGWRGGVQGDYIGDVGVCILRRAEGSGPMEAEAACA